MSMDSNDNSELFRPYTVLECTNKLKEYYAVAISLENDARLEYLNPSGGKKLALITLQLEEIHRHKLYWARQLLIAMSLYATPPAQI